MTRYGIALFGLFLAFAGVGCGTQAAISAKSPSSGYEETRPYLDPVQEGSLFAEDQAAISNDAMNAILAQKIHIPQQAKLSVVRFGNLPSWWGWNESFVRTNQSIDDDFLARLGKAPHIREVAYLPSLVMPPKQNLPTLRVAAARFQADLLLVYRTQVRSYDRQKVFGADETRAYCTVEAILLDVRSGLIPYSTVVTEQFSAKKVAGDYDFSETVAKATQQAIGKAWLRLGEDVSAFMKHAPAE